MVRETAVLSSGWSGKEWRIRRRRSIPPSLTPGRARLVAEKAAHRPIARTRREVEVQQPESAVPVSGRGRVAKAVDDGRAHVGESCDGAKARHQPLRLSRL